MNNAVTQSIGEPQEVTQIAADWALRQERQDMTETQWAEFDEWINADPRSRQGFPKRALGARFDPQTRLR